MCFDPDSTPPVPAVAGGAASHRDLTLTADDGNRIAAFEAFTEGPPGPAVVILPDVRGLYRFYEELTLRFAEAGYDAVAIDYFGRTAGVAKRDDAFPYADHVPQTTFAGVSADVAAAVAHLRSGNPQRPIFTVGFCFGGSNSWHQGANRLGLSGVIGFYGNPARAWPPGAQAVLDRVGEITCPLLGLMGGADQGIPPEVVGQLRGGLAAAGVPHEIVVYPGAPHSFFDRKQENYAAESADAWRRLLQFIAANSKAQAVPSSPRRDP
jgi:carboxymethylenebutenolidase